MEDNSWLNLGSPKADPKWGKGHGSAWGGYAFVFNPDLQGAFLYGEGRPAGVKPDGYGLDDLWFYDINAHAWICLHPGVNTKDFTQQVKDGKLKVDAKGRLVDKNGDPIPIHTKIHAWGFTTYDTDQKRFAWLGGNNGAGGAKFGTYHIPGGDKMKEGFSLLESHGMKGGGTWSPWFYNTRAGKFETDRATGNYTGASFPAFQYLPKHKKYMLLGQRGVWFFDFAKNHWTSAKAKGVKPKGYDKSYWYDSKRDLFHWGNYVYDIKTSTWTELNPKGTIPGNGMNVTSMEYDPHRDKTIGIQFTGEKLGVYIYDPNTNAWSHLGPLPEGIGKIMSVFYDTKLNAYFCHVGGDSRIGGIWVYRCKQREKE